MRGLVGSVDEAVDLSEHEWGQVTAVASPGSSAFRETVRQVRPPSRGLLMIYLVKDPVRGDAGRFIPALGVSLPASPSAQPLAYTVNEVWREQDGLAGDWDDDAEH